MMPQQSTNITYRIKTSCYTQASIILDSDGDIRLFRADVHDFLKVRARVKA